MKSILRIVIAIAIIVASGRVSFDVAISNQIVPISGQSLAVLMSALILPRWEALIAIMSYLGLGALDQPVFVNGESGWDELIGKKAGYLWGFLIATFSVSTTRGFKDRLSFLQILRGNMIGTIIILFTGFAVLAYHYGVEISFTSGVVPYWPGAVIKIIVGSFAVLGIRKLLD